MNSLKTEEVNGRTTCTKNLVLKVTLLAAVFCTIVVPTIPKISFAQDSLITEVLVTARKREERLQDVPSSAAAISANLIEGIGGIFNLRDMTDLVAGVSTNENQAAGPSGSAIRAERARWRNECDFEKTPR